MTFEASLVGTIITIGQLMFICLSIIINRKNDDIDSSALLRILAPITAFTIIQFVISFTWLMIVVSKGGAL